MPEPKVQVTDFEDQPFLEEGIADLSSAFANWETAEGEGTRQLWSMLGRVYELGAKVERNGAAKLELIDRVNMDPNVQDSPKWNPSTKTAYELLLVTLLSIKEQTKAKKSQWYSAIRAARKASVEPERSAFLGFLESVGGIDGARKLHAKPPGRKPTVEELIQWAQDQVDPDVGQFTAPRFLGECSELPGAIGLVLVSGKRAGGKVTPITTIVDLAVIGRAIAWAIKAETAQQSAMELALEKESHERAMSIRKDIRKRYADYKRSQNWEKAKLDFQEFIEKVIDEDDEIFIQSTEIQDFKLRIEFGNGYKSLAKNAISFIQPEGDEQFAIQRRVGMRTRS